MSRIYEEESWRQPVAERIYSLSYKLRRTLTIVLSFCMALFVVSFVHSVIQRNSPAADMSMYADLSGPVPVASAVAGSADVGMFDTMQGMPVASISDPLIVRVQHVPTDPDYFLVFSVLGMAMTLMIINWFTRIRS